MSAVGVGLAIAGIGVIMVLAIILKDCQNIGEERYIPDNDYDDSDGLDEDGCRDILVCLIGMVLIVIGLLISSIASGIAWFISLF